MTDPIADLAVLRASTDALLAGLAAEGWSDEDVAAPSILPDWTRGHVLTHIARNADSITRTLQGALRGEIVERYVGGPDGRVAGIESGAPRPADEQMADVAQSAQLLDATFVEIGAANAWDRPTDKEIPAERWLKQRLIEVEIHRVDLGGRYCADQWPAELMGFLIPHLAAGLGERTSQSLRVLCDGLEVATTGDQPYIEVAGPDWAVLAWLVGRPQATQGQLSAAPELGGWRY